MINKDPLFSIIIPTFNRGGRILRTLHSVAAQIYRNFELIVIDDGSVDDTEDVVKGFSPISVTYQKISNSERGAARNAGVRLAIGDYVTFLDSDDLLYPDYLKNAAESIRKYQYPVFFHLAYEFRNDSGKKHSYGYFGISENVLFLIKGNPLSCLGVFIRLEQALKFPFEEDRDLAGSEDWELWLRLAANFGLKVDTRVSACLLVHDDRSVLSYNEDNLLKRKNLALQYAFTDQYVHIVFGRSRNEMEAYCDTYIALHLIIAGQIKSGWRYFYHALSRYPSTIFKRRTLAIIKLTLLAGLKSKKIKKN